MQNEGIYLELLLIELKHFDQGMVFLPALTKESRKFLLSPGLMASRIATHLSNIEN